MAVSVGNVALFPDLPPSVDGPPHFAWPLNGAGSLETTLWPIHMSVPSLHIESVDIGITPPCSGIVFHILFVLFDYSYV